VGRRGHKTLDNDAHQYAIEEKTFQEHTANTKLLIILTKIRERRCARYKTIYDCSLGWWMAGCD
jgi:hypothetical protein